MRSSTPPVASVASTNKPASLTASASASALTKIITTKAQLEMSWAVTWVGRVINVEQISPSKTTYKDGIELWLCICTPRYTKHF